MQMERRKKEAEEECRWREGMMGQKRNADGEEEKRGRRGMQM